MSPLFDADTVKIPPALAAAFRGADVPSSRVEVDLGALTHQGKVRSRNEDHFHSVRTGRYMETIRSSLPTGVIKSRYDETGYGLLVADGMGGHQAGETASRLAIATLIQLVQTVPDWILRTDEDNANELLRRVSTYYQQVNAKLNEAASNSREMAGMGTTMTMAYSLGVDLFIAHVGDSRAYLFHQGSLLRLTRDQTMAQALVDAGVITDDTQAPKRLQHILTSALGGTISEPRVEVRQLHVGDGDQLLLCSDGLTGMVDDAEIAAVLASNVPAQEACQTLVDRALEKGGKDNVTVLVARYRMPPPAQLETGQEGHG